MSLVDDHKVILKNRANLVVRVFACGGAEELLVVRRHDTRRIEILSDVECLTKQSVSFDLLKRIPLSELKNTPVVIEKLGTIELAPADFNTEVNLPLIIETEGVWNRTLVASAFVALLFIGMSSLTPTVESQDAAKEELREHVVKVVKRTPVQRAISRMPLKNPSKTQATKRNVSRLGALSVLGSLNSKSASRGGIKLDAIQTSAGPGQGGSQGSGGVQSSLYGKGLVAAPVGPGANIKGAGGYGTKGKGGGQAGYGQLSLVGSSGTEMVPLGSEAEVEGGLDREMIAAVIRKNMGQIRFCYEQGLQAQPQLTGRVAVDFTITGSGTVATSRVSNTSLNSKLVEDCIVMRLKTWKFPLPVGGVEVKVSYPFLLKRAGA